ncbi:hypothetical protein BKA65DRAFT_547896 [Rhexocercosporidium sp. MPI-PUGE-AT-0058]|nr:hypothetical protein BKA65DRAFT_547896 [Rhexocercosporidium sp. MPI-PUGE-AT-0058]
MVCGATSTAPSARKKAAPRASSTAPRAMLTRSRTANIRDSSNPIGCEDEANADLAVPDSAHLSSSEGNAIIKDIGTSTMSFQEAIGETIDDDDDDDDDDGFGRSEDEGIEKRVTKKRRLNSPPPASKYNLPLYQSVSQSISEDNEPAALGSNQASYLPPDFFNSRTRFVPGPGPINETRTEKAKRVKGQRANFKQAKASFLRKKKETAQAKKEKANLKTPSVAKRNTTAKKPSSVQSADNEDKGSEEEVSIGTDAYVPVAAAKKKPYDHSPGYDATLPPIYSSEQMISHLGQALINIGMRDLTNMMKGGALKVGTFCSGTEAPVLVMRLLKEFFSFQNIEFNFDQIISAEIEPNKSAFIERNFSPGMSARDITEILSQRAKDPQRNTEWYYTTAYGGRAKIPGDLDLLIAGFCCDDFSNLNSHRKKLNEKGESGDTFFAVLEYVDRYRPKMVVLENVNSAPWLDSKVDEGEKSKWGEKVIGIDKHFEDLGYVVSYMKLDTKQFYVPHTRERCYMVCVLSNGPDHIIASLKARAQSLPTLVNSLKRFASVPIQALMSDFDSPLLDLSAREEVKPRAAVTWDACRLNHQKYVEVNRLGSRHPITHWDELGHKTLPDYYKRNLVLTDRTMDYIDISHLRNISLRGFDDRYYSRFLDLSQNVYRFEDTLRNGIVSCITPSNFLLITTRGGCVTGTEAFTAQGYNPKVVDIMNVSDTLLGDMSGNAMTTTVVGAVIFAALISFRDVFDFKGRPKRVQDAEAPLIHLGKELLEYHESHPALYVPVSVNDITALAGQTVRLCVCEGRTRITSESIQQCKVCKATSCVTCGHNPVHHYEPLSVERKQPIEFEIAIKKALPFQIDLGTLSPDGFVGSLNNARKLIPLPGFTHSSWNYMIDKMKEAFASVVFFRGIRRAHCFQIRYDSPHALLKLEVSSSGVEWLLYANVPDEPLATSTGKYLRRFALARMRPTGDDIMEGNWQLWIPEKTSLQTTITSSGPLERSFENERGLIDHQASFVYPCISVTARGDYNPKHLDQDILGDYVRSSECGQAWNSVHARESRDDQKPLLLFYNQHLHTGDPKDFFFSFTNDVARKLYAEELSVVCDLPTSWRQPTVIATQTDLGFTIQGVPIESFVGKHVEEVDIWLHGYWKPLPDHQLDFTHKALITYRRLPAQIVDISSSCGQKRTVFEMDAQLQYEPPFLCKRNKWYSLDNAKKDSFCKEYLCFLEKELVLVGHGESDNSWIQHQDSGKECSPCAPTPPSMQWTFDKKKIKGKLGQRFGKQIPVENPEEAAIHERAIKSRPLAIDVVYRFGDSNLLECNIVIDPVTLIHRATGSLLLNSTFGRTGQLVGEDVQTSYRLVTDEGKKADSDSPKFALPDTRNCEPSPNLMKPFTDFWTKPFASSPANENQTEPELNSSQAKVLAWMLDQERNPQPFTEQVVAEASVKEIGYRLEGKATRKIQVAGGILAQEVGFGKTILILSIIALNLQEEKIKPNIKGKIYTRATLVLVPTHLVDQWGSEAENFMRKTYREGHVIAIKSAAKFKTLTVAQIQRAVIVIASWNVCSSPSYQKAYAQFSGNVRYADNATMRAQREWHRHASTTFAANVEALKSNYKDPGFMANHLKGQHAASIQETNKHDAYIPSKHVTGAKYKHALEKGPMTGEKRKRKVTPSGHFECLFDFDRLTDSEGIGNLKYPLLEMFHWDRVVIDEHTYAKPTSRLLFEFVHCSRVWLLSGTPALGNFHNVKGMASLLGINLGCDDHSIMKQEDLKKMMKEYTASEKFAMYQEAPTAAWQKTRMQHAQAFLNQFVRQDRVDLSGIKCEKKIIGVHQNFFEKAMYMEIMQHVVANDFLLTAVKATSNHQSQKIHEVSSSDEDGKLALFLKASGFRRNMNNNSTAATTALEVCKKIVNIRVREYSEKLSEFYDESSNARRLSVAAASSGEYCEDYDNWLLRARGNYYGDHATTNDIRSRLRSVAELPATELKTDGAATLRASTTKLNTICEELVTRKRSLRAFQSVHRIQRAEVLGCSQCKQEATVRDLTLLAGCGHLICSNCTTSSACGVVEDNEKCTAPAASPQQVTCASLQTGSAMIFKFGSKIDYVVNLIQNKVDLYSIPEGEKVLLFIRSEQMQQKLAEAFTAVGIKFATLSDESASSSTLADFQSSESCTQVLFIVTADVTAAGSNLTIAPNLIFFEPLYTKGSEAQECYDRAMIQALGRSLRMNQKKTVKMYELLATNTIEVDYREHRGDCILQPVSGSDKLGSEELEPVARSSSTCHGPLSSTIACITKFDD